MTENELRDFLDSEDLLTCIDVKTLVMDLMARHTDIDEIVKIFHSRLFEVDIEYLNKFRYMKRK